MATFVKIPIQLYDGEKAKLMGLDNPEKIDALAYIDPNKIESIRHGSDDSISEELNTEGSVINMQSGDSFAIRMPLDELIEYLSPYLQIESREARVVLDKINKLH